MDRAGIAHVRRRHFTCLLGVTALTGVVLAGNVSAAGAPAGASTRQTSSCVACHTDSAKLQEEAKGIPQPAASALQAGKG
jgi:nitrate/TMAO reductase-like tetraheme cytochrome c subunit